MVIKVFLIVGTMFFVGWRVGKWLKAIAEKHFKELEKIDYNLKKILDEQREKQDSNDSRS